MKSMTPDSGPNKSKEMSGAEAWAWAVITIFVIGTGMAGYAVHRLFHYLVIALAVLGALVVVMAFAGWKVWQWQKQREARLTQATITRAQSWQVPAQQQALPPTQNNTLSIPHTWTPEEAARFIRLTRPDQP